MKVILNKIDIKAIASYLPTDVLQMSSLYPNAKPDEIKRIIATTGIDEVRIAKSDQTASDMCIEAAKEILIKQNINPSTIDGLVFVSQTKDYILPATSVLLQDKLGLPTTTVCIDIEYGCSGYIYGLFQASLWIASGACQNVLVLAGDTSSKIIHPDDRSLRMVFGDCGTATLLSKGENEISFSLNSDGSGYDKLIIKAGGYRTPLSSETKKVEIDIDNNVISPEHMFMDGMAIFNFAITKVHKDIEALLDYVNWDKQDVDLFALHQANVFMLNFITKKLKVDPVKVPCNVNQYGNTASATIPLLLTDHFGNTQQNTQLKKIIMSGFGVGLSWGSIATDLSKTMFYKPINSK